MLFGAEIWPRLVKGLTPRVRHLYYRLYLRKQNLCDVFKIGQAGLRRLRGACINPRG